MNPGSHFMNTAMYDAREAMAPGGMYDRSGSRGGGNAPPHSMGPALSSRREEARPDRQMRHDPLTYIAPDRQGSMPPTNLPIPVGIFMNMAHVPPRFYNQHQQMLAAAQGSSKPAPPPASSAGRRLAGGKGGRSKDSQLSQGNSQDISQGGYSQGPLTQGGLQLSQGDLSQDSLMQGDLHSQLDGLLSQDSTYQGDRFASQHQYLSQFSQQ